MPTLVIRERSVVRFMPRRARLLRLNLVALSYSFTPSGSRSRSANSSVNLSPVADRKDPNEPGFAIDFMDKAKRLTLYFHKPLSSRRSGSPENGFELKRT